MTREQFPEPAKPYGTAGGDLPSSFHASVLDLSLQQLEGTVSDIDGDDSKALTLIGVIVAALLALLAVRATASDAVLGTSWALRTFWWAPLPGAAVSVFFLSLALRAANNYTRGPSVEAVTRECDGLPMEEAFAHYRDLVYEAIYYNVYVGRRQGSLLRTGIRALLVTGVYSTVLALLLT